MSIKTIGVIGAMAEEIERLRELMEELKQVEKAGIVFYIGSVHGQKVFLCKCGVGKVNASVCAQIMIDYFQVQSIIFTGVAGALDPELNIGDIVISLDCQHHDMDATALGFSRGTIPFAKQSVFAADPQLIQLARESSLNTGYRIVEGRILSGDQFIADRQKVSDLYKSFGGACTEMEGAAVAQTCVMNEIPFVIIRSISDKADGSATINFSEFTVLASEQSSVIVAGILKGMIKT